MGKSNFNKKGHNNKIVLKNYYGFYPIKNQKS